MTNEYLMMRFQIFLIKMSQSLDDLQRSLRTVSLNSQQCRIISVSTDNMKAVHRDHSRI